MLYNSTNTVQGFMRSLVWILTFVSLTIVSSLTLGVLSIALFASPWVFMVPALLFNAWLAGVIAGMIFILPEWERLVLLRLGKFVGVRGPGLFIIPPFVYSVAAILDTRIETHQVEATATLTKDNVPTKITAAIEFRVEDPQKAVIDVQNYRQSVIWLSTEALKNTIGSMDLKEILSERDEIAANLKVQIDSGATTYGIDVRAVRITDVDTPPTLIDELAVIARARRSAEAKRIEAEAEVEVATMTTKAAEILRQNKGSMRLRELQVLSEMSKEESSMVIIYPYGDRVGQNLAAGAVSRGVAKLDVEDQEASES
ncbi:hypothetical protein A3K34_02200 [candidate division WWE3 bacterium RIFOXYC1_FULL_40_10]|nr:MAG: hypothetical protein A3K58_02200 [candidate division WWE3 bacterium RIFOXYB1_FULL_40_22]OGC61665.1 MAG: hypothetical protein A3K37_02200 [candidate division WWE3 bacterium RIFOXYA1_FULL_40_11]OGC64422.1 MAG: hypothetical protein A2326_02655 [candidate division WWE3 bacterium RIFOXYB2_FULL_41_6]OGC66048.1 MAG: hypothetical protein A3K34_02200 [candidate division WWE3 bacterium RIFOXYC1_FULL_40_10]OGC70998.1 MAG: hypothetical protein A2602_00640 [candidate division WWE3 bacterium RIFOXYD1